MSVKLLHHTEIDSISIFTHHAGTDDVILVYLLVKIINFTHSQVGYVGPLNIFTDHAQLTDHASQRLLRVCRCLLIDYVGLHHVIDICAFSHHVNCDIIIKNQ
jgi:hypothetical protein